jgi:hypothetical protein
LLKDSNAFPADLLEARDALAVEDRSGVTSTRKITCYQRRRSQNMPSAKDKSDVMAGFLLATTLLVIFPAQTQKTSSL